MHPLHPQKPGVVRGDAGYAHEGAADGGVDLLRQRQQLLLRSAGDKSAAEIEEGPVGCVDARRRLPDALLLGRVGRVGGNRGLRLVVVHGDLDVLGHVHQHRAGTAGDSQPECLPNGVRQVPDLAHEVVVLGDGQGDAGDVDLLEGVGADLVIGDVAGDRHHGDGIQKGGGDAGDQVGGAGAGGGDDHAGLPGGPGPAVGGVGGPLLVGGEDVPELVLVFVQGIVDMDHLSAGVAENGCNALLNEGPDNNVRAGQFHGIILSRVKNKTPSLFQQRDRIILTMILRYHSSCRRRRPLSVTDITPQGNGRAPSVLLKAFTLFRPAAPGRLLRNVPPPARTVRRLSEAGAVSLFPHRCVFL